jgi:FlaG/FlaF family flagellin (archaellin)
MRTGSMLGLLLIAVSVSGPAAIASTTGGIRGSISDQGTGLPEAAATITMTSRSARFATLTNQDGFFVVIGLLPDRYYVTYTLANGRAGGCMIAIVPVLAGEVRTVRFELSTGRGLLSCAVRRLSVVVDGDETGDVYSFGADGNLIR